LENKLNFSPDLIKTILQDENGQEPNTQEISGTEHALGLYANAYAKDPSAAVKDRIKAKMAKLNHQSKNRAPFTLKNLPMLTPDANLFDWEQAVAHILPPMDYDNIHMVVLASDETRDLMLGWSKEIIPEEVHDDLIESFIVLEGSCECHIWRDDDHSFNRVVHMQTGDFLQLNIGESHDIITTSSVPVKAILQRLKVRA
jgi:mannose-6-phosphate isomerase-like protein (cupin superfamily)